MSEPFDRGIALANRLDLLEARLAELERLLFNIMLALGLEIEKDKEDSNESL